MWTDFRINKFCVTTKQRHSDIFSICHCTFWSFLIFLLIALFKIITKAFLNVKILKSLIHFICFISFILRTDYNLLCISQSKILIIETRSVKEQWICPSYKTIFYINNHIKCQKKPGQTRTLLKQLFFQFSKPLTVLLEKKSFCPTKEFSKTFATYIDRLDLYLHPYDSKWFGISRFIIEIC